MYNRYFLIKENLHVFIFVLLKIKEMDGSPCRVFAVSPEVFKEFLFPKK